MTSLDDRQRALCDQHDYDFSGLSALFLNCTLKPTGTPSSTEALQPADYDLAPGASYADEDSGGPENDFTQRNTTFMTWNLLHLARLLRAAGGIPAHGNQRSEWEAGCRFDHPNPDYR